jgi:predicted esterase
MTKEERLTDIEDVLNYMDAVYASMSDDQKNALIAFGFSQGTPSIFRWVVNRKIPVKACVAWASDLPQDVLTPEGVEFLNKQKIFVVLGNQDEFVNADRLQRVKEELNSAGLNYEFISFEGKHRILEEPLLQLYQKINE